MDNCDDLDNKIQELIDIRNNEVSALRKILNSLTLSDKKKKANGEILLKAKDKRD